LVTFRNAVPLHTQPPFSPARGQNYYILQNEQRQGGPQLSVPRD
jgi:hypothetical protein